MHNIGGGGARPYGGMIILIKRMGQLRSERTLYCNVIFFQEK